MSVSHPPEIIRFFIEEPKQNSGYETGGHQVAIVFGLTHGPGMGDYRLSDERTGQLLSEVPGIKTLRSLHSMRQRCGMVDEDRAAVAIELIEEISKMLAVMRIRLKARGRTRD